MSDAAAVFLFALGGDEVLAFSLFKKNMIKLQENFLKSQKGIQTQLAELSRLTKLLLPEFHKYLVGKTLSHDSPRVRQHVDMLSLDFGEIQTRVCVRGGSRFVGVVVGFRDASVCPLLNQVR